MLTDEAANAIAPGPKYVLALLSDLIFESKVTATARAVGVEVRCVRTVAVALGQRPSAAACIVDLHLPTGDAVKAIRQLRATDGKLPIVAFGSHVQKELLASAVAAGASRVLPRSGFAARLGDILQELTQREYRHTR